MTLYLGFLILALSSVLLGKMIFDRQNRAIGEATEPVLRNFIWQIALLVSSIAGLLALYPARDEASTWVWMLVSLVILAFAATGLVRSVRRSQASSSS